MNKQHTMIVGLTKQIAELEEKNKENKEKINVIEFRLNNPKGYRLYETMEISSLMDFTVKYHQTLAFYHEESNSVKRVVFDTRQESLTSKIEQKQMEYAVIEHKNDYEIIFKGNENISINGIKSRIFISKGTGEKSVVAVSSIK